MIAEFLHFDPNVHTDAFRQMYIEWLADQMDELKEGYGVDFFTITGRKVEEIVDANMNKYSSLKPPNGILIILEVDDAVAGMVALMKLNEGRGYINLMYNRTEYRGKGLGKQLLLRLIEEGRKIGVTCFQLRTPVFSHAAHHIYKSVGFEELEEYSESLMPKQSPILQPYSIYMEKKEQEK
jgi:GNAT superfamily N-acetyltransferase